MLLWPGFALVMASAGIALFHPEYSRRAVLTAYGLMIPGMTLLMVWRFG